MHTRARASQLSEPLGEFCSFVGFQIVTLRTVQGLSPLLPFSRKWIQSASHSKGATFPRNCELPLQADKLRPDWKENLLYIAKTYICEGHYTPAMAWLDRAAKLPSVDPGDDTVHKEVENLQEQYQRYRP